MPSSRYGRTAAAVGFLAIAINISAWDSPESRRP
jgi:hypothetical protein